MQTKFPFSLLITLFFTATVFGQKSRPSTVINDNNPLDYSSFSLQVVAGKPSGGFSLWISNPEKKKLILEISQKGIGTLIDTVIYADNFSQRYNMNQADDGNYTITVSAGREKIVKEIELNTVTTRNILVRD